MVGEQGRWLEDIRREEMRGGVDVLQLEYGWLPATRGVRLHKFVNAGLSSEKRTRGPHLVLASDLKGQVGGQYDVHTT